MLVISVVAAGLACYPMGGTIDGKHGDHVILSPPYIVTARDVEMIVERFGAAVDEVFASLSKG
jgi:adenosylmethionine-8-amino-7-oxononanoate aminotransferase